MLVAQCLTAFFAVWITHQGCDDSGLVARTQRSRLVNFLSYNMFFHLEHHMFPGVPVKRLPELAERLDNAFPQIAAAARRVVPAPRLGAIAGARRAA
jgi:fatty acid desaturase